MAILEIKHVSKFFGGLAANADVSFSMEKGMILGLIGPNGAGKTTLFNVIGGQLSPTAGRIFFQGQDITRLPAHRRAHLGIVRSFQISTLLLNLTVLENALLTFHGVKPSRFDLFRQFFSYPEVMEKAGQALDMADLWDKREVPVKLLSYGEQRRLEVVLSIASDPRLLLLDEPSCGLTNEESASIIRLIKKSGKDVTVLVVAHDMDFVFEVAERINVLYYGGLLASGTPDEIRDNPRVKEIYMGLGENGTSARG
jgi:branched-chain amino acid transport system ATP-binding protein